MGATHHPGCSWLMIPHSTAAIRSLAAVSCMVQVPWKTGGCSPHWNFCMGIRACLAEMIEWTWHLCVVSSPFAVHLVGPHRVRFFFLLGSLAPQELGKEPKDDPNFRIIHQGIKHGLIKLMKTTIEHTPSTRFWVSPRLGGWNPHGMEYEHIEKGRES